MRVHVVMIVDGMCPVVNPMTGVDIIEWVPGNRERDDVCGVWGIGTVGTYVGTARS